MKIFLGRKTLGILFFLFCGLSSKETIAQQTNEDTFLVNRNLKLNDSLEIDALNAQAFKNSSSDPYFAIKYAKAALELSYKKNYLKGISSARNCLGIIYSDLGNYNLALKNYIAALDYYNKTGSKKKESAVLMNMAVAFINVGQFQNALKNTLRAIEIKQKIHDSLGLANAWLNLGLNYYSQKEYSNSEKYSRLALNLYGTLNNNEGKSKALNNLANVEYEKKNSKLAIELYLKAIEIQKQLNNKRGIASTLNNLGLLQEQMLNYKEAEIYYNKALLIRQEIKSPEDLVESFINLAELKIKMNNGAEALINLKQAEQLSRNLQNLELEKKISEAFVNFFERKKDFNSAYIYKSRLLIINDTLYNIERQKKIQDLQAVYDFEVGEKRLKKSEQELMNEQIGSKQKSMLLKVSMTALLLLLVFSIFLWRLNKQRQIASLKVELQKKTIEEKNKDILDSINYAQRIQQSFLPLKNEMDKILGDYFIYFKPRDIVSGDFYWAVKVMTTSKDSPHEEVIVVACADCTGHGVPGSMMSMIGNTLLNQTIKNPNINSPAEALDFLNNELPKNLKKQNQNDQIRDGMDIVMCAINKTKMKFYCAAANNPIWIVRNDGDENIMITVIPDKQAITASDETQKKPFTNHTIDLLKEDVIYLFTDGYADQFGGPKGKKFKYKQMQQILLANFAKPMDEQKKILNDNMKNWMGDLEQVDDILIIGIRV